MPTRGDTPKTRKQRMGEALLEQHGRRNTRQGKHVDNPDGTTSTIRSGSYRTEGGKERLIPHVYDGKVVGRKEANRRAKGVPYPEYDTPEQATRASKRISDAAPRRGKPRK